MPPTDVHDGPETRNNSARALEYALELSDRNADKERAGELTVDDVRAEHQAAFASLSPVQLRALVRMNRAFRESHLGNCSAKDALAVILQREAQERNSGARQDGVGSD
jgi:hypothetical protein